WHMEPSASFAASTTPIRRLSSTNNSSNPDEQLRPATGRRVRHPPRIRPPRQGVSARGQIPRSNPEKMEGPHRRLASSTTHEWAYRGGQQPHQENQADRLRVPQLPVLPGPGAALRRKTQLGPVSHRHSPLNSEVPDNSARARPFKPDPVWSNHRLGQNLPSEYL